MALTTDATELLGAGTARASMEWLRAAESADEYGLRLKFLQEQMGLLRDQQEASSGNLMGGLNFSGGIGGLVSSAMPEELTAALGPIGMIIGLIQNNPLTEFISSLGQAVGGIAQVALGMAAWTIFQDAASWVQNAVTQMFQLNNTMERFQSSWAYQFTPAGQNPLVQGKQIAAGLSEWTLKESLNLPFTRQDMLSSITALSKAGVSADAIKEYMPYIADIAATSVTMTGDPVSLSKAAYAIQGATHGMSRMLRYDLGIDPAELAKYGYTAEQPWMLLPALKQWAIDHNRSSSDATDSGGAAMTFATSTFWGEQSSFIDRLQNLGLEAGGYDNATATTRKGSLFDTLKTDLEHLSSWIDDHQTILQTIGTIFGKTLADTVNAITDAFRGLFNVFSDAGFGQNFLDFIQGIDAWLVNQTTPTITVDKSNGAPTVHHKGGAGGNTTDPTTTQISPMQQVGDTIGKIVTTNVLPALGQAWSALMLIIGPSIPVWQNVATDIVAFFKSFNPTDMAILTAAGMMLSGAIWAVAVGADALVKAAQGSKNILDLWAVSVQWLGRRIRELWQELDTLTGRLNNVAKALNPLQNIGNILHLGGGGGTSQTGGTGAHTDTHAAQTGLAVRAPGGANYAFGRFG
jgi:hypothetical protein